MAKSYDQLLEEQQIARRKRDYWRSHEPSADDDFTRQTLLKTATEEFEKVTQEIRGLWKLIMPTASSAPPKTG